MQDFFQMFNNFRFKVKIELLQCPSKKKDWKDSSKIYRVGRLQDGLVVDWELICDCPCEDKQNWVNHSFIIIVFMLRILHINWIYTTDNKFNKMRESGHRKMWVM